jgi:hypothetical protein
MVIAGRTFGFWARRWGPYLTWWLVGIYSSRFADDFLTLVACAVVATLAAGLSGLVLEVSHGDNKLEGD